MLQKTVGVVNPFADAFGLSEREADHAHDWTHASSMLASARDVFDSIEEDNYRINHAPRGAEGPAGNFSNVCRRSLRQLAQLLQDEHLDLVQLGVPQRVLDVLSPRSLLTLAVENFFTQMRARWPNPYSLQYQSNHARACLLHSFQSCGASGFAYFTGTHRSDRHYTDAKSSFAPIQYRLSKPKPQFVEGREEALCILREFARLFQQVKQQRVTDKAKEKVAAQPSIAYAPVAISIPEPPELQGLDEHRCASQGNSTVSEVHLQVLYRAGDIVGVSGGRAGLWFAQMEENLVRQRIPASGRRMETVKYNTDRPKVRYFVRTCELASWPLAAIYWGLAAVEEAHTLSESSNGVHFSFEKSDSRVTLSVVRPSTVSCGH